MGRSNEQITASEQSAPLVTRVTLDDYLASLHCARFETIFHHVNVGDIVLETNRDSSGYNPAEGQLQFYRNKEIRRPVNPVPTVVSELVNAGLVEKQVSILDARHPLAGMRDATAVENTDATIEALKGDRTRVNRDFNLVINPVFEPQIFTIGEQKVALILNPDAIYREIDETLVPVLYVGQMPKYARGELAGLLCRGLTNTACAPKKAVIISQGKHGQRLVEVFTPEDTIRVGNMYVNVQTAVKKRLSEIAKARYDRGEIKPTYFKSACRSCVFSALCFQRGQTPLTALSGVRATEQDAFALGGIHTVEDLVRHANLEDARETVLRRREETGARSGKLLAEKRWGHIRALALGFVHETPLSRENIGTLQLLEKLIIALDVETEFRGEGVDFTYQVGVSRFNPEDEVVVDTDGGNAFKDKDYTSIIAKEDSPEGERQVFYSVLSRIDRLCGGDYEQLVIAYHSGQDLRVMRNLGRKYLPLTDAELELLPELQLLLPEELSAEFTQFIQLVSKAPLNNPECSDNLETALRALTKLRQNATGQEVTRHLRSLARKLIHIHTFPFGLDKQKMYDPQNPEDEDINYIDTKQLLEEMLYSHFGHSMKEWMLFLGYEYKTRIAEGKITKTYDLDYFVSQKTWRAAVAQLEARRQEKQNNGNGVVHTPMPRSQLAAGYIYNLLDTRGIAAILRLLMETRFPTPSEIQNGVRPEAAHVQSTRRVMADYFPF